MGSALGFPSLRNLRPHASPYVGGDTFKLFGDVLKLASTALAANVFPYVGRRATRKGEGLRFGGRVS